jgi:hypothetical protein
MSTITYGIWVNRKSAFARWPNRTRATFATIVEATEALDRMGYTNSTSDGYRTAYVAEFPPQEAK